MILNLILAALLFFILIIIVFLVTSQRRHLKKLSGAIARFSGGKLNEPDSLPGNHPLTRAARDLQQEMHNLFDLFNSINLNSRKSERSTGRLSQNIQKALIYTAKVSTNAEKNKKTSEQLFEHVSHGSAAVEEIHASIRSLKEQILIQNREIAQTSEAIKGINQALKNVSEIASSRIQDTFQLEKFTAVGNTRISETDKVISTIQNKVGDVLTLITVINNIADQTNLLSMNAAIEAAHAGAAGRGFAVVAQEIRNLSTSTAKNARSISETLKALVQQIQTAGELSKESGNSFTNIENGVRQVSEAFAQINENTNQVFQNTQEVVDSASALQEISEQTTTSMNEMEIGAGEINVILEKSKSISNELDASMRELSDQARGINLITTRISSSFLSSNQFFQEVLESFRSYTRITDSEKPGINASGLILSQIHWVATARAVFDGSITPDEGALLDSKSWELDSWLEKAGTEKLLETGKYTKLKSLRENLFSHFSGTLKALNSGNDEQTEQGYRVLVEESEKIIQILTTLGTNEFIRWSPAFSVGVATFDNHHKKLIEIINRLYMNMEEGQAASVMQETLGELIDYTDYHFSAEEKAFETYGYPGLKAHREQHQNLLTTARELQKDLLAGRAVLSDEVLDFLQDWVMNHILKSDTMYTNFLKGKEF